MKVDERQMKKFVKNICKNSGPSVVELGPFVNGQNGLLYKLKLLQQHQAADVRRRWDMYRSSSAGTTLTASIYRTGCQVGVGDASKQQHLYEHDIY